MTASGGAWLFGVLSLDIYIERDVILPGGGVLNMAWHWRRLGKPFRLLSRIGNDHPGVFLDFLDRHGVPYLPDTLVGDGPSASIDIVIRPDGQPWMDHFVDGVWGSTAGALVTAWVRPLPDDAYGPAMDALRGP